MQDTSSPPPDTSLRGLLQNRPFSFYVATRVTAMLGMTLQAAAVTWQVYELTGQALPLAFLGVARFLPSIAVSFIGGALADTRDRRLILAVSQVAPLLTSLWLWALTITGTITLTPIYLSVALLGLSFAFEGPARMSLLPQVVPRASFQRAVVLATTVQQVASVLGGATGGLLIANFGVGAVYLYHAGVIAVGLLCLLGIRVAAGSNPRGTLSLALIREGLVFIWTHPAILGAMALDLVAVIFAGADALLPIYANEILGVGPAGYGMFLSAKGVGTFGAAIVMALLPPIVATGRTLILTIALYGLATIAFGLSTWFPLSLLFFALTWSADQVSVVMRQSIIQLGTPDALRGRVSAVGSLFVGASNQLGPVESGVVATLTGSAVVAVVSGGMACLAGVGILHALIPSLWRHRLTPLPSEERPA